jgi:hypothetical protein
MDINDYFYPHMINLFNKRENIRIENVETIG